MSTDISKTQDDEVGDGTTSVVVLAGELLREAEQLINQKIHPATIIAGYREAAEAAQHRLESIAMDHGTDPDAFRADLINIARTTLSSKILTSDKDHFAELAVDAVLRLKGSGNLDAIQIIKRVGGTLRVGWVLSTSFLIGGNPSLLQKIMLALYPVVPFRKSFIF